MLKLTGIPRWSLTFLSPISLTTTTTKPLSTPFPLLRLHKLHISLSPAAAAAPISTSTVDDVVSLEASASDSPHRPLHPWPEWIAFVDGLKSKGYTIESKATSNTTGSGEGEEEGEVGSEVYTDMKFLKDGCLNFARDRLHIFKSLSTDNIQEVVKNGCPNLLRKNVNSAKRLRAYVKLNEAEVCGACILRGSCDRAYLVLNESEAVAGTVDIMRILLTYAVDPSVLSSGMTAPVRDLRESCTRRLIQEMTELSESTFDATQLPEQSAVKTPTRQTVKKVKLPDDKGSHVDMKRGDWMCPKCDFLNFARNIQCLKCNEDGPRKVGLQEAGPRKGDWMCPECNFMNFSRNTKCLKCQAEGPERVVVKAMKKGDWNCPQCQYMNFASNSKCFRCSEPRPPRDLKPGDWECTLCDFWNFSRKAVCVKCGAKGPIKVSADHLWKRPQTAVA
ncbi:hypothetical protein Drorol1_Dr00007563 [Drosera rotundifolia]